MDSKFLDLSRDRNDKGVPFWEILARNSVERQLENPHIGPCLEWTGQLNRGGYGFLWTPASWRGDGYPSHLLVHRLAWILTHGSVQSDQFVLHRCDNRPCFTSRHLFLGSKAENNADRDKKGRTCAPRRPHVIYGEANNRCRMSDGTLAEVRAKWDFAPRRRGMVRSLAKEYGLSESHMSRLLRRKLRV